MGVTIEKSPAMKAKKNSLHYFCPLKRYVWVITKADTGVYIDIPTSCMY